MNTSAHSFGSNGIQTAGMVAGGAPGSLTQTETYNGSTWTSLGNILNNGRDDNECEGSVTAALCMGGNPGTLKTETFNGSTWTEVADSTYAKANCGGAGTQALALGFGSDPAPLTRKTEEWNGAPAAVQTVTTSEK